MINNKINIKIPFIKGKKTINSIKNNWIYLK